MRTKWTLQRRPGIVSRDYTGEASAVMGSVSRRLIEAENKASEGENNTCQFCVVAVLAVMASEETTIANGVVPH